MFSKYLNIRFQDYRFNFLFADRYAKQMIQLFYKIKGYLLGIFIRYKNE